MQLLQLCLHIVALLIALYSTTATKLSYTQCEFTVIVYIFCRFAGVTVNNDHTFKYAVKLYNFSFSTLENSLKLKQIIISASKCDGNWLSLGYGTTRGATVTDSHMWTVPIGVLGLHCLQLQRGYLSKMKENLSKQPLTACGEYRNYSLCVEIALLSASFPTSCPS